MQSHFPSRQPSELMKKSPFINSTLSNLDVLTTPPATLTQWKSHQLEQWEFISRRDAALLVPERPSHSKTRGHTTQCNHLSHCLSSHCCQGTCSELPWSCLKMPFRRRSSIHISSVGKFAEGMEDCHGMEQGGKAEYMQAATG